MASPNEFDHISDDIDFSAIGEEEWNAIQTQPPNSTSYSSQPQGTVGLTAPSELRLPSDSDGHLDNVLDIAVPEFVQGPSRINVSPMYQIAPEDTQRYQLTRPSTPVQLNTLVPVNQPTRADTPDYFSDDAGDIDDAFLHELDQLETRLINGSPGAVAPSFTSLLAQSPTVTSSQVHTIESNPPLYIPDSSLKRRRIEESLIQKGKLKFEGDWTDLLDEYEDEMNCPICCDVLVAAHLVNGCGHSMCGPCGYQWIVEKHRNTCPVCRTPCHGLTPLIPNITVDHFVQKHLRVRALLGDEGWKKGGANLMEWQARKDQWVKDCAQRKKKTQRVIIPREIQLYNIFD